MTRSRQTPTPFRLPDPPADYDAKWMRQFTQTLETALRDLQMPVAKSFTITHRDNTAITLDVTAATLAQTRAFLGELAIALIGANKIGGEYS